MAHPTGWTAYLHHFTGRQLGKSLLLAVIALWHAYRKPGQLVLIVSAGEVAARRLLEDIAALAQGSELLRGAVLDDRSSVVTLSNGSVIRSVPASQRQIRGWAVDLLIVDEAAFVDPEVWRAAEPSIIARPGSRVILSSSPYGAAMHFFRLLWRRGMDAPDEQVRSWHWPSTVSPLVDGNLLEEIRRRESPVYFAREYLAEWTEGTGAYFSAEEIDGSVADYELIHPGTASRHVVVGGVDWGLAHDANAVVLLGTLPDPPKGHDQPFAESDGYFVAHLEEHFHTPYSVFIDRLLWLAGSHGGFSVRELVSETNGVGQMPTETLRTLARQNGIRMAVVGVHTDYRHKESSFGAMKMLLQQGRLVLPRHPSLLRQLAAVEFETSDTGNTRIAVPESAGHDDLGVCCRVG